VFLVRPFMYFVDYSQPTIQYGYIGQMDSVIEPSISPDGMRVLYAKGPLNEMSSYWPSSVYLCDFGASSQHVLVKSDTAYAPHFRQNTPTLSVTYASTTQTDGYKLPGAMYVRDSLGHSSRATDTVFWSSGTNYGGMSWDNRYLCSAMQDAVMLDLSSGSVAGPLNWYRLTRNDGSTMLRWNQASDPSISSSRLHPNIMMCLDFGYSQSAMDTLFANWRMAGVNDDRLWGPRDAFLLLRSDSTVMRAFIEPRRGDLASRDDSCMATGGLRSVITDTYWGTPEWSNHPYFAASNVYVRRYWCPNGVGPDLTRSEIVYLVNLVDSTYLPLARFADVTSTNLGSILYPYVWVDVPHDFEESDWLAESRLPAPVETAPRGGSIRHAPVMRVTISGERLTSTVPMACVRLYSMVGTELGEISVGRQAMSVSLTSLSRGF